MKTSLKSIIQEEVRKQLNEVDTQDEDVMKNPDAPMPYVSLGGNSKDSLLQQTSATLIAIRETVTAVAKNDMFHGRNSMDSNHRRKLIVKKDMILKQLRELENYFESVLDYIYNLG